MPKLNQIVAIEKGVKSRTEKTVTASHQALQKEASLNGLARTYNPDIENGETYPDEHVRVQIKAREEIKNVSDSLTELFDITLTKDTANCYARADIVVDDKVLVKDVPITTLLFIEKKLDNIHTFVAKLPVLSSIDNWTLDANSNMYRSDEVYTNKTKKVLRNHVKAAATDKHPAQVDTFSEDIVVGKWKTVKFSGSMPAKEINDCLARVEKLRQAVKFAREEANAAEAKHLHMGEKIFGFIFG